MQQCGGISQLSGLMRDQKDLKQECWLIRASGIQISEALLFYQSVGLVKSLRVPRLYSKIKLFCILSVLPVCTYINPGNPTDSQEKLKRSVSACVSFGLTSRSPAPEACV